MASNPENPVAKLCDSARKVERSVVGLCLREGKVSEALDLGLLPEHFYDDDCRQFFAGMVRLEAAGKSIDLVSMNLEVPRIGPDGVSSAVELVEISEQAPVTQNLDFYANEVMALCAQRKAIKAMQSSFHQLLGRKPFEPVDDAIEQARASFEGAVGKAVKLGPKPMEQILDQVLKNIETRADDAAKGITRYISTGIKALNFILTGGLYPGRVYVLAGRPGTGKTMFANHLVRFAAGNGKKILNFTLEMPAEELVERSLSNESRVSGVKLAKAELSDEEIDRMMHGAQQLHRLPIMYDDTFRGDVKAMLATCRRMKRTAGVDMIVIDYLQLLSMKGTKKDRVRELSDITMEIKLLAGELRVPIILLSAINREAKKHGDDHGPGLENLKDSGSIEQDADTVIILHVKEDDRDKVWMNVAKNRGGSLRRFPVAVDFSVGLYRDLNLNME